MSKTVIVGRNTVISCCSSKRTRDHYGGGKSPPPFRGSAIPHLFSSTDSSCLSFFFLLALGIIPLNL